MARPVRIPKKSLSFISTISLCLIKSLCLSFRTLLSDCIYGGKIDNEFDQRLLRSFLEKLFVPASFDSEFSLASGMHIYICFLRIKYSCAVFSNEEWKLLRYQNSIFFQILRLIFLKSKRGGNVPLAPSLIRHWSSWSIWRKLFSIFPYWILKSRLKDSWISQNILYLNTDNIE